MDFVETQAQATPEVAEDLAALGELFFKKLYHELTTALRTFVQSDAARQRGQLLLDLEEKFLSKVESKLNQLQYAMILGDLVVGAVDSTVISAQEGIERLKKAVEDKRGRFGAEPSLYLEMEAALFALRGADRCLRTSKEGPGGGQTDHGRPDGHDGHGGLSEVLRGGLRL